MEPTDFFKTAELLKSNAEEEANIRTSIGRSYYAAFLFFREWLRTHGLEKKIKPSKDTHAFVNQCLGYSQVSEGSKASQYLRDLQQLREDADYNLDTTFSQEDAKDTLVKAMKVVDDYKSNITTTKEKKLIEKATVFAEMKSWI